MKWKADVRPTYGLMIKYLEMIMPAHELEDIINRYVEAKKKHLHHDRKNKASH